MERGSQQRQTASHAEQLPLNKLTGKALTSGPHTAKHHPKNSKEKLSELGANVRSLAQFALVGGLPLSNQISLQR